MWSEVKTVPTGAILTTSLPNGHFCLHLTDRNTEAQTGLPCPIMPNFSLNSLHSMEFS